jgi:hypothetical protein
MEAEVSFHRLAELELNEAAAYYELERPGLGARFLREIDRCIDSQGVLCPTGLTVFGKHGIVAASVS